MMVIQCLKIRYWRKVRATETISELSFVKKWVCQQVLVRSKNEMFQPSVRVLKSNPYQAKITRCKCCKQISVICFQNCSVEEWYLQNTFSSRCFIPQWWPP